MPTIYNERGWVRALERSTSLVHVARRTNGDFGPVSFPICAEFPAFDLNSLREDFEPTQAMITCLTCLGWKPSSDLDEEVYDVP